MSDHFDEGFAPLTTGMTFGRTSCSDFIGSLRGQSEMVLHGMSSDPHNGVNSLDLILIRLQWRKTGNLFAMFSQMDVLSYMNYYLRINGVRVSIRFPMVINRRLTKSEVLTVLGVGYI